MARSAKKLPKKQDRKITKYFYKHANQLIEETYLQPYNGRVKKQVRDGHLERMHHGALHATRVSLYIKVLHSLISQQLPTYVKQSLKILTEELQLTEKEIINLVSFAGLCHDSGRKGEGTDYWDNESGQNCTAFLIKKGLPTKTAEIFGQAAAYKDHPKDYANILKAKGISEKSISAYHYLRKLIYLADCYDIMRVRDQFELEYVFRAFQDIKEYQAKKHNPAFIEFAQQVHALIILHQDMRQVCHIVLPDGKKMVTKNMSASYRLSEKIRYEHADNALISVMQSMKTIPYFAQYLSKESCVEPSKRYNIAEKSWLSSTQVAIMAASMVVTVAMYFSVSLLFSLGYGLAAYCVMSLMSNLYSWYCMPANSSIKPANSGAKGILNEVDKAILTKAPEVIFSLSRSMNLEDKERPVITPLNCRVSRCAR